MLDRSPLLAALIALSAASPAAAATSAPVPDVAGGAPWVVRTTPEREDNLCLQVGQLDGGRLVRHVGPRTVRLGRHDRAVCDLVELKNDVELPLDVERLADDPAAPAPRIVRTIVAGFAGSGARSVSLSGSVAERLRVDPRSHTFLAVLPGRVRRDDLVLHVRTARSSATVDFRRGPQAGPDPELLVPGSVRTALTLPSPTGGPPVVLTTYRREPFHLARGHESHCQEVGRLVDGEVGAYSARWGSFLDAPTLLQQDQPQDSYLPVDEQDLCANVTLGDAELGFGIQRLGATLYAVHGPTPARAVGLTVTTPGGRHSSAALDPRDHVFLAAFSRAVRRNDRLRLRWRLAGGGTRTRTIALGAQEVPVGVRYARLRAGGRVLHLDWSGGVEPFVGVRVRVTSRAIAVSPLDLDPPPFQPDGSLTTEILPEVYKCADVVLPAPAGRRRIVSGVTHHPIPAPPREYHGRKPCPRVRPGQRVLHDFFG